MEKIPYKPGDVLVDKLGNEITIIDLTKNEYIAFTEPPIFGIFKDENGNVLISNFGKKEDLDKKDYTLKTPKEESKQECEFCKKMHCFGCFHNANYGVPVSCECHFIKKETPTP